MASWVILRASSLRSSPCVAVDERAARASERQNPMLEVSNVQMLIKHIAN